MAPPAARSVREIPEIHPERSFDRLSFQIEGVDESAGNQPNQQGIARDELGNSPLGRLADLFRRTARSTMANPSVR